MSQSLQDLDPSTIDLAGVYNVRTAVDHAQQQRLPHRQGSRPDLDPVRMRLLGAIFLGSLDPSCCGRSRFPEGGRSQILVFRIWGRSLRNREDPDPGYGADPDLDPKDHALFFFTWCENQKIFLILFVN